MTIALMFTVGYVASAVLVDRMVLLVMKRRGQ